MSVWGPGPFDSDDAADWLGELEEELGLDLIEDAVAEMADMAHVGYIEITDCCVAVAAAEVLAQLLGKAGPTAGLDDEVWSALAFELREQDAATIKRLVEQAFAAVRRVLRDDENSELRQVWEKDKSGMVAWTAAMQDLLTRLQAVAESRG